MSQDPIHLLGHVTNLQLTCQSGQWGHLKPTWVRTSIRAHVAAGGIWSCVGCGVEGLFLVVSWGHPLFLILWISPTVTCSSKPA